MNSSNTNQTQKIGSGFIDQGSIQAYLDSVEPLWVPKKTAPISFPTQNKYLFSTLKMARKI